MLYLYSPDDDRSTTVSEELGLSLYESLTKLPLPNLSSCDQAQLTDMIKSLALVEKHHRSLDANGMRYLLNFQWQMLGKASGHHVQVSWREIAWAYHSESQDILVDQISRQYGRMLWKDARESGLFMWMTDLDATVMLEHVFDDVMTDIQYRNCNSRLSRVTNTLKQMKRTQLTVVFTILP